MSFPAAITFSSPPPLTLPTHDPTGEVPAQMGEVLSYSSIDRARGCFSLRVPQEEWGKHKYTCNMVSDGQFFTFFFYPGYTEKSWTCSAPTLFPRDRRGPW